MTQQHIKDVADVVSASTVVAAIVGWLPAIATVLTIIWTAIRIYEYIKNKKIKE